MKETKNRAARDIIVVGFALFSMFFGAGNVIFPPYLGMESGPQWLAGFSAYFIADIGLALAAMFAQQRGCAPARRPCAVGDPHVRDHSVRRPHGRHPAHVGQHV